MRRSTHAPSSVGDERVEHRAVVVGRNRSEAAAADDSDTAPLRPRRGGASPGRRPPRRAPPRPRAPVARARPARPRAASPRVEADSRSRAPSPSRSRPHAASTIASSPRSPRLRRRVSMFPRSGSIESDGSSASSCARRRTDAVPMRIPAASASAPHSASRGSSRAQVRADGEPVRVRRGHVLRGVDGDVDPPGEQRLLELLDEDAARADLAERPRPVAVAGRRDRDERDLDARAPQPLRRLLGLREREPTAAGADAYEHSEPSAAPAAARTRLANRRNASAHDRQRPTQRPVGLTPLLPESEQVPHGVGVDQHRRRRGGLLHPHRRQVQELVDDLRRDRVDARARLEPRPRAAPARWRGSPRPARAATRSRARRRATPARRGSARPRRHDLLGPLGLARAGREASPRRPLSRSSMS